MIPTAACLTVALALTPFTDLPTQFWGITPAVTEGEIAELKPKREQAVVLIHGLIPRVLRPEKADRPEEHSWQTEDSLLVKGLKDNYDVFGFSYAQTQSVDTIAVSNGLRDGIAALKKAGYKSIILVGHSVGAIIAREFVAVYPKAGVTKVVAVAAPFLGSGWAKLPNFTLPKTQVEFINSLLPSVREPRVKEYPLTIAKDVEFCCVLCRTARMDHDTVVSFASQWPIDLQDQGIPLLLTNCTHFDAMTSEEPVKAILQVVKGKVVRWEPKQVEQARTALFGPAKK